MQNRTRIFTAVTVLAGFLLGVGVILSFQTQKGMPVNAANSRRHHHIQIQTVTVTHTVTNTNTVTAIPPGPMCFAFPNPAIIGSGSSGSGNPAGNVQFILQCTTLDPRDSYTVSYAFPTCATGVITFDGFSGTGATGAIATNLIPDANGRLTGNFQLGGCTPTQTSAQVGTITLTNTRTLAKITTMVMLAAPGSAKH